MDAPHAQLTREHLASITRLLHQAAIQVWHDAERAGPGSPLHDLGLGIYLARCQASALLPEHHDLADTDLEQRTPLQLLTCAERLTRSLPQHPPDLIHASPLVIDLCDLIREARGLGY